jgi:P27 family predicted phage terminase small subunit
MIRATAPSQPYVVKLPPPPKGLSAEARKFWTAVVTDYTLEAHHLAILERACEQLDRLRAAQAAIGEHGLLIDGRFGLKPNPAVGMARDATTLHMRALRELGLDLEAPATSRPPSRWHQ